MGKNLKGRECGKGIYQRKDGSYCARYSSRDGKRKTGYFKSLAEARNWLHDALCGSTVQNDETPMQEKTSSSMTVNQWVAFWMENLVCDLAPNTRRNYQDRYQKNIQPVIGDMAMEDVKPMHCKIVLNRMEKGYSGATMRQAYITMGIIFRAAVMNEIIVKHPMDGVRFTKPVRAVDDFKCLTLDEQRKLLDTARRSHNFRQYAFLLETGLRTAELIGLTWDSVDWERHTLTVSKTLEYRHCTGVWRAGPPKSASSYRTIPLTQRAYEILLSCYNERFIRKESSILDQSLEYMDRRNGQKKHFVMKDLIFINWRTGEPTKNSSYDTHLYKLCEEAGIKHTSMHMLRHTYATRAIEAGVQPKVLQKLLGHSSIKITMDRYVHVTNESLLCEVEKFEKAFV